ncbi:MAG: GGDEF domain-containing protein [Gammaproteobacteria bacterium]|jgi:diguanylate cyclase (GGDEF)-like protein
MVSGLDRPEEIDPGGVGKLLHLLEALRETPAGNIIYRQVECMLDDLAADHLRAEMAYAGFVRTLLNAFVSHLTPGSPQYVQARLLQARLHPPLTPTELQSLGEFVEQIADRIQDTRDLESTTLTQAVSPLLRAFGIDIPGTNGPPVEPVPDSPQIQPAVAESAVSRPEVPASGAPEEPILPVQEIGLTSEEADAGDEAEDEGEFGAEIEDEECAPPNAALDEEYRAELESRREDIKKLQSTLGQQVVETITQNEEFGNILELVLAELRQANEVDGVENVRWTLVREIEKLMKGHNDLADKLDNTHHYLQLIESDSRELTDELTRVRLLSLTDELTDLPNRRAFMRRLEDEVARVQRYGFPLSFALIDLDHFKEVNDMYGHAAGDEVLRVYSKNILSVFRHHDMVARYGGEEFAVLLPNTDADGTIRALNKVKRRAAETRWQSNGTVSQVPTFSAGVSLFKPGESACAFIERADKALYRAKRLGRDRIELDITYETEERGRAHRRRSTDI